MSALAIAQALLPRHALAQTISFYGAAAETARVPEIKAPLLIHAESDERVRKHLA